MGRFSIFFTGDIEGSGDEKVALGRIAIGDFHEDFHASLSYWNIEQYWEQWRNALERAIEGKNTTALISSMYDPQMANFIFWWVLYLEGLVVYIQNHVLFMEDCDGRFDETCLYDYIPARETVNENGEKISEWTTNLESLKKFLHAIDDYGPRSPRRPLR